jgi:hypothetical protein
LIKQIKKAVITVTAIALTSFAVNVAAAEAPASDSLHDVEAEALLKKMSDYMKGLKSFSADLHIVDEQIMGDGFKLSVLRSGTIKLRYPNKLYVSRKGLLLDQESFFDGNNLVIYGKNLGMTINIPVKGNIDAALDTAADVFDAELPGRDLLTQDIYTPLMEAITESTSLGSIKIGDETCRQLAFRTNEVDYQLWVAEGDQPLPCRYTITTKWTYAAPQYTVTFTNWQVNQEIPDNIFTLSAPKGTKQVTVDEFRKALKQEAEKK